MTSGEHGDEHQQVAATGEPGIVRIDPEMLRDLRVTTAPVESRTGGDGISVLGELRVNQDAYAEIGVAIPARVTRVTVKSGDRVSEGQLLVELQSAELGKARAALIAAQAKASLARKTVERKRGLANDKIVSAGELQAIEADLAAADADVRASRAALTGLGAPMTDDGSGDASKLSLRSPLNGVVIDREAAIGQMADPAKALLRVGDLAKLWVNAHAFERDALRVRVGATARVTFPALPGRSFDAKVSSIGPQVDVSSRTLPIRLEIDNADGLLRPGMSANAWLPLGDEQAVIVSVPSAALQRLKDGWFVFVPQKEGAFEIRAVGRGRDLAGEVEIVSGVKPGERVVVEGAFLLKAESEKSSGEGEHHEH